MTTIHQKESDKIISRHSIGNVLFNSTTHHHSFFSVMAFKPGDIVAKFYAGSTQNHATYLTVQVGGDTHITLEPQFLQYINHSCDPNVFFDTTSMQVVCVRPIQCGDELGFFYPSAEWEMAQPFVCGCGSKDCLQFIKGAAHLSAQTIGKYRFTDFILQQINLKK